MPRTFAARGGNAIVRRALLPRRAGTLAASHIGFRGTRGFSVVIAEDTGQMSAAVVAHDGAFVISGACTTFTAASH